MRKFEVYPYGPTTDGVVIEALEFRITPNGIEFCGERAVLIAFVASAPGLIVKEMT